MRSASCLIGCILLLSFLATACSNTIATNEKNLCPQYISSVDSRQLIKDLNQYVEVTNLCYTRETPSYVLDNELAASGSNNDKCAGSGQISVVRANQLVDVLNKMINDSNRCTGGSNFPPIQPREKFSEG